MRQQHGFGAFDLMILALQAGSYAEFMAVLTNVLLGMQIPMTSYQQVCYCITNDVIMSISLMYEKPEWGAWSHFHGPFSAHLLRQT
jgi:hypothetical protein